MFELEALLLGLEPVTALTIGVGALLIAPVGRRDRFDDRRQRVRRNPKHCEDWLSLGV